MFSDKQQATINGIFDLYNALSTHDKERCMRFYNVMLRRKSAIDVKNTSTFLTFGDVRDNALVLAPSFTVCFIYMFA